MFRLPRLRFWALLMLSLLAACGNAAGQAAPPNPSPAAIAPQAAVPATANTLPATRPAPATAAAQPTAATSTEQTAAPAANRDIPESVTAEGYHVLGRADAPVTLTMYSDFL
jgi:multidrug efflux pump subunit AcrA (membrane-fusion protein)